MGIHIEAAFREQTILKKMLKYYEAHELPGLLIFSGPHTILKEYAIHKLSFQHLCFNSNSCNQCQSCLLLKRKEHPDFIYFPYDKVKIGNPKEPEPYTIRWLQQKKLVYKPYIAPKRLVIFPSGEKLGLEAEIALLKTLEEPRKDTHFVIFTPSLDQLKDTIVSRGVVIVLKFFSIEQMKKISDIKEYEFLEMIGGNVDFLSDELFLLYKELSYKIMDSLEHPIAFLELEEWCYQFISKSLESYHLKPEQFWEFFSLILLQKIRRSKLYLPLAELILQFLTGLRAEQPGLLSYLIGRLFYELNYQLFFRD